MIQMNNSGLMTIDRFNKLTGHETLHPLICMVDLSKVNLTEDIRMMCNFYGLLYYNDSEQKKHLKKSGCDWFIPAKQSKYPRTGIDIDIPDAIRVFCFIPICYATHRSKTVSKPIRNAVAVKEHCRSTKETS